MVGNAILGLVFANIVFYKSTILLLFEAEVTDLSRVYYSIRPTLVWAEEKLSQQRFSDGWKMLF